MAVTRPATQGNSCRLEQCWQAASCSPEGSNLQQRPQGPTAPTENLAKALKQWLHAAWRALYLQHILCALRELEDQGVLRPLGSLHQCDSCLALLKVHKPIVRVSPVCLLGGYHHLDDLQA